MANKTFKSLTPQGLDTTYKVPATAPEYAATNTYAVGDLAVYQGVLYKCTTAIDTPEAWTVQHWQDTTIGDEVSDLKESIKGTNPYAAFEEKNVSGSIASFSDGADNIPVKNLTVNIDPVQDLHGYDHPWPAGGGKNLLDFRTKGAGNDNGATFSNNDGVITVSGTPTGYSWYQSLALTLPAGQYLFNGRPVGASCFLYLYNISTNTTIANVQPGADFSLTLAEETSVAARIIAPQDATINNEVIKPMIRLASVADSTFAPYSNICPITGHTSAKVTRTGKNLLNITATSRTINGVTFAVNNDGTITANGTSSGSIFLSIGSNFVLKKGTYILSGTPNQDVTTTGNLYITSGGARIANTGEQFTLPNDTLISSVYYNLDSGATVNNLLIKPMIEVGTIITNYEPYSGATYDITFPSEAGTVYGGNLVIAQDGSGTLTVDKKYSLLNSVTFSYQTANGRFVSNAISDIKAPNSYSKVGNIICSQYVAAKVDALNPNVSGFVNYGIGIGIDKNLCISDTRYTDANQFNSDVANVAIVYELENSRVYTFTADQVTTLLGYNNIWADTGDIAELAYRAMNNTSGMIKLTKALIAPVLDSMVADTALVVNDFRIVGDTLYKVTAPIASGGTLTAGTNVTATTIGEQITVLLA